MVLYSLIKKTTITQNFIFVLTVTTYNTFHIDTYSLALTITKLFFKHVYYLIIPTMYFVDIDICCTTAKLYSST